MNLLVLNYEFPPLGGGGGAITWNVTKRLAELGYDVTIVTSHYEGSKMREVLNGVTIYRVPTTRRERNVATSLDMATYLLSALPLTRRLVKENRYDLTHCYFALPTGLLALFAKKVWGVPYIVSMFGTDVPGFNPKRFRVLHSVSRPLWEAVVSEASAVTAVSESLKRIAEKVKPELEISIIPPGVDCEKFHASDKSNEKVRILFVGRMDSDRKGVSYLLEAVSRLKSNNRYELVLVGDGPFRPKFESYSRKLGTDGKVEFVGNVYGQEMARLYRDCDIFSLPSLAEGIPVAILEAMASGLPIVATNVGGIPELVSRDCGILVPPRDVEALGRALSRLVDDGEMRRSMGRRARERAERSYSWESVVEKFTEVFKTTT